MRSGKTRFNITMLTGIALLATTAAANAGIAVWLDPADPTVEVGATTTVDIIATCDAPIVGWGIDLNIDETGFADWIGTAIGADWDATDTIDEDGLAGLRFPTGVSGDVLLATLTFEGLAQGETTLSLSVGDDEDEGFLLEAGGFETDLSFAPATLTVTPEPTAFALLLLSTSMIALRRRR